MICRRFIVPVSHAKSCGGRGSREWGWGLLFFFCLRTTILSSAMEGPGRLKSSAIGVCVFLELMTDWYSFILACRNHPDFDMQEWMNDIYGIDRIADEWTFDVLLLRIRSSDDVVCGNVADNEVRCKGWCFGDGGSSLVFDSTSSFSYQHYIGQHARHK